MKEWPIVCSLLFLSAVLINPKTRFLHIIKEQFKIYKNDKNNEYYWLDFLTFITIPVAVAIIIALNLPLSKILSHAETIITVFSLIATLPLSFLALFIDKILQTKKEKEVAKEAFVSINIDILYSMLVIGIVIVASFIDASEFLNHIIVGLISFFTIKVALNILMILKRIFIVWEL